MKFLKSGRSPILGNKQEIALAYWGLWEPESVMNSIIADYQKDRPWVKINYSLQSSRDYRERLQSSLARGDGPDIFRFHQTWLPMFKNDLAPVPSGTIEEDKYYPVMKDSLSIGKNLYGVPLMIDTLALFINEDIFRAAGKTPPTNWDDLVKIAIELTVRDNQGRIQTAGVALGTTNNVDHWSDILGLMMLQNGVEMTKVEKTIGSDNRNLGEDVLTFYGWFSQKYRVWDETLPSSTLAFASGKLAMYFGPSWRIFELKGINPDLKFSILPVPQLPGTNLSWASFWVEGVWGKSQNKEEAFNFLKYLSQKETLQKLYQAESNLRLFGELYPRTDMANLLADNPLVAPFLSQAATARSWYLCSQTFDNGLNDRMIKYFEDAVNGINQGKSATEALATAGQGVTQLLSQYGIK
jgi:multiple sugar transport system substrate-binding protein